jgi:hypothetical protein
MDWKGCVKRANLRENSGTIKMICIYTLILILISFTIQADDLPNYCELWKNNYPPLAAWVWRGGDIANCQWGELNPEAILDGVDRVNLYRRMCGLPTVMLDEEWIPACTEGAGMCAANNDIDHYPPKSWKCYTELGAAACGSSNLSGYSSSMANSVDDFIEDYGNATTMGHRRWNLYPALDKVSFGCVGYYVVQRVFYFEGTANPDYVAWPTNGIIPVKALSGSWTLSVDKANFSDARVLINNSITRETILDKKVTPLLDGYGWNTCSWEFTNPHVNVLYDVVVSGIKNSAVNEVSYQVELSDCKPNSVLELANNKPHWNYSHGRLTFSQPLEKISHINIFSLEGSLIFKQLSPKESINIDLPSNLYLIRYSLYDSQCSEKLLVVK